MVDVIDELGCRKFDGLLENIDLDDESCVFNFNKPQKLS